MALRTLAALLLALPAFAGGEGAFFEALALGQAELVAVRNAQLSAPAKDVAKAKAKVLARLNGALPAAYVDSVFADPRLRLDMRIPPRFAKPSEALPYERYRQIFITETRIAAGAEFFRAQEALLDRVVARYGVDKHLLVGLVGVETFYGRGTGAHEVANALYTIIDQVPSRETFAVRELAEFLKFTHAERLDVFSVNGSYAGAFGLGQFIPSSFNGYSVDFDGDGRRRWDEWPDMFATISNYLKRNGYRPDSRDFSQGSPNYRAIHAYNHSDNYVRVVLELRQAVLDRLAPPALARN